MIKKNKQCSRDGQTNLSNMCEQHYSNRWIDSMPVTNSSQKPFHNGNDIPSQDIIKKLNIYSRKFSSMPRELANHVDHKYHITEKDIIDHQNGKEIWIFPPSNNFINKMLVKATSIVVNPNEYNKYVVYRKGLLDHLEDIYEELDELDSVYGYED